MRKLLSLVALMVLVTGASASTPAQSAADAYAACLIGNAVLELTHGGMNETDAAVAAFAVCEALEAAVSENELEGISDFLYSTLSQIEN